MEDNYSQLFNSIKILIQCPICFCTIETSALCPSCNILICKKCYDVYFRNKFYYRGYCFFCC